VIIMLTAILQLAQEPTPMPSPEPEPFLLTPILYILIVMIIAGIVAWKYKAIPELVVIICTTLGSFILGFIAIPDYPSFGLAIASAFVGLMFSTAIVIVIRLIRKAR